MLGPAGSIYLSKQDFTKYLHLHLSGAVGASDFLSQDSFQLLHRSPDQEDYAMGWRLMDETLLAEHNLSRTEQVLYHGGNTGIASARTLILPDRKLSIFIALNLDVTRWKDLQKLLFERLQITE